VLRQLARWCRDHDTTVAGIRDGVSRRTRTAPARNGTVQSDADAHVKEDARG